jgi:hypothetical protein
MDWLLSPWFENLLSIKFQAAAHAVDILDKVQSC